MRFKLYRENGALNSQPVFNALEQGIKSLGHTIVSADEDIPVIWSVLWAGRMERNRVVYNQARLQNKPVLIIEVGNLKRNSTWRISLNHINRNGEFANDFDIDYDRSKKLGLTLLPTNQNRKSEILLATQHQRSLQWENMPTMNIWAENTIKEIQKYTDRKIIVRPHPRSHVTVYGKNIKIENPNRIPNSYDDFDIDYNYHCVINHNSGPAVQAAIHGSPIICDSSSLAYPVSDVLENIESIQLKDREEWFAKLCHTEWTVEEIAQGLPLQRLLTKII